MDNKVKTYPGETKEESDSSDYLVMADCLEKTSAPKTLAKHLIEFWYKQMALNSFRDYQKTPTGRYAIENATSKKELQQMEEDRPSQYLTMMNPMREYNGLMSDSYIIPRGILDLSLGEYVSAGSFPLIKLSDAVAVGLHEKICAALLGEDESADEEVSVWKLYQAQGIFLQYEEIFDKILYKNMVKMLKKTGVPQEYTIYQKMIIAAFKATIDELGGIEKFKEVRETLYRAQEKAEKSGWYTFSTRNAVAHFRKINEKKIAIYHSGLQDGANE